MLVLPIILILILTGVAYKLPELSIYIVIVLGLLPELFLFTYMYDDVNNLLGLVSGFLAVDLILLGMAAAVLIKLVNGYYKRFKTISFKKISKVKLSRLTILIVIFTLLLLWGIVRNVNKYGISAPGEFRFRYLILIIPLYISQFVNSVFVLKKLLKTVLYFSVIVPLIFIPFIILNHSFNSDASVYRLFGSEVNLFFLFSLLIVFMLQHEKEFKLNKSFNLLLIPISVILITDAHRSVWISASIAFLVLLKFRYIKIKKIFLFAGITLILFFASLSILKNTGINNPEEYLGSRASEIVTAEEGGTGYWRLLAWIGNINTTVENGDAILGEGFGGYWYVYIPEFNDYLIIFPHNLYVMTFVKLGLAGLIIYLLIIFELYKEFANKIKFLVSTGQYTFHTKFILLGIVILIAQNIYYLMYSFGYVPLIFLGLVYSYFKMTNLNEKTLYNHSGS